MRGSQRCPEGARPPVKCPKCGYVSYPGLPQCKKCGHQFVPPPSTQDSTPLVSPAPGASIPSPQPSNLAEGVSPPGDGALSPPANLEADDSPERVPGRELLRPWREEVFERANLEADDSPERVPGRELLRPWREELSERVENFRRRRARVQGASEPSENLHFDFEAAEGDHAEENFDDESFESEEVERDLDVAFAELGIPDSMTERASELALEDRPFDPDPVEILRESLPYSAGVTSAALAPLVLPLAPMSRRFFAGLVDAWVLLWGGGLFALVFWLIGGRLSPQPLNLVVLGFIAAFFILLYFGLFTALASATPGLHWLGLEVRNLEGDQPTPAESLWRAFGYLVSIAGLMLGFIWALLDTEGLTWHDRISGTFLTLATPDRRLDRT